MFHTDRTVPAQRISVRIGILNPHVKTHTLTDRPQCLDGKNVALERKMMRMKSGASQKTDLCFVLQTKRKVKIGREYTKKTRRLIYHEKRLSNVKLVDQYDQLLDKPFFRVTNYRGYRTHCKLINLGVLPSLIYAFFIFQAGIP